jgi:hypothetical protein
VIERVHADGADGADGAGRCRQGVDGGWLMVGLDGHKYFSGEVVQLFLFVWCRCCLLVTVQLSIVLVGRCCFDGLFVAADRCSFVLCVCNSIVGVTVFHVVSLPPLFSTSRMSRFTRSTV